MDKFQKKYPQVGIGIMIINDKGEMLLGLRQKSHGAGEWSFPGGGMEFGETMEQTAKREAKEETSLEINDLELVSLSNESRYLKEGKQHIVIGFKESSFKGQPQVMEPNRCLEWRWFLPENLPVPLFEGTELMIKNYLAGRIYQPDNNS